MVTNLSAHQAQNLDFFKPGRQLLLFAVNIICGFLFDSVLKIKQTNKQTKKMFVENIIIALDTFCYITELVSRPF